MFSVYCFTACLSPTRTQSPGLLSLLCLLLDPQGLALSGHLTTLSSMNGAPLLLVFILTISLCPRNGPSLASSIISPCLLCGLKPCRWNSLRPCRPLSPRSICIARISSLGFSEVDETSLFPPSQASCGGKWGDGGRI